MEMTQNLLQSQRRLKDLFVVLGASIILSLSAWISIPLPFTPVPISFTVQLALFFAVALGKRGFYATALYLIQGALGLPVFANGGCGLAYFMGPTGGYLIGFLMSAYALATLVERIQNKTPAKTFGLMLFGNALIYVFGVSHLALLIGGANALKLGLLPFVGGDLLKILFLHRLLLKKSY